MKSALRRLTYGASVIATTGAFIGLATVGASAATSQTFEANLSQVNNSGASGTLSVKLNGDTATITETLNGVVKSQAHTQHLNFSNTSSHTCPTSSADTSKDGIISAVEARPFYGSPVVSLTTSGDTSAGSALAMSRYPSAPNGTINFNRSIQLSASEVQELEAGQMVAVVHGIDVNHNGKYDTDAGTSPLAKAAGMGDNFPLEATAPAACGVVTAATTTQPATASTTDNTNYNKITLDVALGLGALGTLLGIVSLATAGKKRV